MGASWRTDISSTAIYTKVRAARTAGAVMGLPSFAPPKESGEQASGITGRDFGPHGDEGSGVPRNHEE